METDNWKATAHASSFAASAIRNKRKQITLIMYQRQTKVSHCQSTERALFECSPPHCYAPGTTYDTSCYEDGVDQLIMITINSPVTGTRQCGGTRNQNHIIWLSRLSYNGYE